MNNMEIFRETIELFTTDPVYAARTAEACKNTKVYLPGFVSDRQLDADWVCSTGFMSATTLQAAQQAAANGERTAILCFANPVHPGGGVTNGARAQEEDICRASDLYLCLTHENAASYYAAHRPEFYERDEGWLISSDRVIYTEGCTVIRRDVCGEKGRWTSERIDEPYTVNVLTCAAPGLFDSILPEEEPEYRAILNGRIRNILEVALHNRTETLILGAFGCGVFYNPPRIVAQTFHDILSEERYRKAFRKVIFAVRPGRMGTDTNTAIFQEFFG
ncbi:MAG: TIGR02452 family protein [Clostridia bacterium]|nr:TIGR02452 family protein [Clostridia bacterium]